MFVVGLKCCKVASTFPGPLSIQTPYQGRSRRSDDNGQSVSPKHDFSHFREKIPKKALVTVCRLTLRPPQPKCPAVPFVSGTVY